MTTPAPEITVDAVGRIDNAAKVIAGLHHGEKQLVFVVELYVERELLSIFRGFSTTSSRSWT